MGATASYLSFVGITILWAILKYKMSESSAKIITGIYILLVVTSQFFMNLSAANEICHSSQYKLALTVTIIPWVMIFGILNVMLLMFPGWKSPFSNTFGYLIAKLTGLNDTMINILNGNGKGSKNVGDEHSIKKQSLSTAPSSGNDISHQLGGAKNKGIYEALEHIYADKSLLVNEITMDNFESFWSRMVKGGLFKANSGKNKSDLKSFVRLKDIVSETMWYILTGGLITSVSYNSIVNGGCQQSIAQMKKRHTEYEANQETIAKQNTDAPKKRVYTSYE